MTRLHRSHSPRVAGFSLIELMIALVAGLLVVGAVLSFTVSSVKANADFVASARLMQELRNVTDYINYELKRAGYDEAAMVYVANPSSAAVSKFAPIKVENASADANCVIYAYDRSPGTPGGIDLANGEIRAIRRSVTTDAIGVIEVAESAAAAPDCAGSGPDYTKYPATCASSGWCPLSDPRVLNVTVFTIGTSSDTNSHGMQTIPAASGFNAMQLRELAVTVEASLRNDAAVSRRVESNIKVRADCLRANVSTCDLAPTP